jgi:hypothetical protein
MSLRFFLSLEYSLTSLQHPTHYHRAYAQSIPFPPSHLFAKHFHGVGHPPSGGYPSSRPHYSHPPSDYHLSAPFIHSRSRRHSHSSAHAPHYAPHYANVVPAPMVKPMPPPGHRSFPPRQHRSSMGAGPRVANFSINPAAFTYPHPQYTMAPPRAILKNRGGIPPAHMVSYYQILAFPARVLTVPSLPPQHVPTHERRRLLIPAGLGGARLLPSRFTLTQ